MDIKFESILMTDTMPNLVKKVNSAQDTLKSNILNILNGLDINVGVQASSDSGSSGTSAQNTIGTNTPIDRISTKNITLCSYGAADNILDIKYSSNSSNTDNFVSKGYLKIDSEGYSLLSIDKINVGELTASSMSSNDSALEVNGISIQTRLNYNIASPSPVDNSIVVDTDTSSYSYIKNTNEEGEPFEIYFKSPQGTSDVFSNGDVFNFIFDKDSKVFIQKTSGSDPTSSDIEIINNESGEFDIKRGETLQLILLSVNKSSSGSSSNPIKYTFAAYILK